MCHVKTPFLITAACVLCAAALAGPSTAAERPQPRVKDTTAPTVVSTTYQPRVVKARRGSVVVRVVTVIRDDYSGFGNGAGVAIGFKSERGGQSTEAAESVAAFNDEPIAEGSTYWQCPDHEVYEAAGSHRCRDSFRIDKLVDGRITQATIESFLLIPRFAKRGRWYLHCGLPNVNDLAGNRRTYYVQGVCNPNRLNAEADTVKTAISADRGPAGASKVVPYIVVE